MQRTANCWSEPYRGSPGPSSAREWTRLCLGHWLDLLTVSPWVAMAEPLSMLQLVLWGMGVATSWTTGWQTSLWLQIPTCSCSPLPIPWNLQHMHGRGISYEGKGRQCKYVHQLPPKHFTQQHLWDLRSWQPEARALSHMHNACGFSHDRAHTSNHAYVRLGSVLRDLPTMRHAETQRVSLGVSPDMEFAENLQKWANSQSPPKTWKK